MENEKLGTAIVVTSGKGGVGKTTTAVNLGIGLANRGKRVLLIDCDGQGNLSESLGFSQPDNLPVSLSTLMQKVIDEKTITKDEGILHHNEGVDLLPANIELSGIETVLVNIMSREQVLKGYINKVKDNYDFLLIDCSPSLGMLTLNALVAANEVIIPVQAQYLPAKGLEQLLQTIAKVKRQINSGLKIGGILMTMVDRRTNLAKNISKLIRDTYGKNLKVYKTEIPLSVKAAETSAAGKSIYSYDKNGKAAQAYRALTREVLNSEKVRTKYKSDPIR